MKSGLSPSAESVARFLLLLASTEEEPEPMTPLRLQKLLYYAEGWSLTERNRSLFDERIEAWMHGPVVREVWEVFKGSQPINPNEGSDDGLSDEEKNFVRGVWEAYKEHSGLSLREMTHSESPWLNARKGLKDNTGSNREITRRAIREYFSTLV
jgi:uncharacterized phage-associated protein